MLKETCTIYMVRHGQSDANVQDVVGLIASKLSPLGIQQAKTLSKNLAGVNFGKYFASEYVRAQETAKKLSPQSEIVIDRRLNEWGIGNFDGMSQKEFNQRTLIYFDKKSKLSVEEKFEKRLFSEMETPYEVVLRLSSFIRENSQKYRGKNILAATHAAALGFLLIHFKHLQFEQMPVFGKVVPNTSFIKIISDGDNIELKY